MARPKAALPGPEVLHALLDAEGRLVLRVTPGAKTEALEIVDGRLLAKVRAQPEDGKANEAVRALLARALGIAGSRVELIRGTTSRQKQFQVTIL
ncbi:DUF167 domain-containing protein [Novosphingobium sp. BL-52-GroH]|uniref:DUF167 domain-containing protein n=1 Tax=Novosphingobium sp. BL-52-GroH TaxID=3349877 RepID=UPI00384D6272